MRRSMHATAASILRGRVASTHAIQSCVAGYSVEVTPAAAKKVRSFAEVSGLREGTTVNVTFLPGSDVADTVGICERLSDAGMLPVAHLPARSFAGLDQVEDYLRELAGVGVREVLVLAGGAPEPAGALTESLEILRSGLLEKHGMERVGVAAHPEGHPNVSSRVLMSALLDKAEWAKANSTDMYYETQFCFEASPIMVWEGEVRAALKARLGASAVLPEIRLGVAGPAKISSLIRFGILSGGGELAPVRAEARWACVQAGTDLCT
eukprot:TRINITY_DN12091_c0_g1_i2.p1 TRINITY_DN12091_c0_g1~~TRINITY_DN12091_c0_g1_i2.p1  ORF type:complete len:266 (-),score=54.97 TRINITY_DN12091_c0_g1_i2:460-1257(-)